MTKKKLRIAFLLYALLALAAWWSLAGEMRLLVSFVLGAFALKSWIAWKKEQIEDGDSGKIH
jgi:predicted negative regulator of RcsB-dependent stress response